MVTSPWRTPAFQALTRPLEHLIGARSAKPFGALGVETVGDLLRHVPRHLMAGTELTDLAALVADQRAGRAPADDYVALVAHVASVTVLGRPPQQRLEVRLTDGRAFLDAAFFGRPHLISYWQSVLSRSHRGIFAGKLGWFHNQPQLVHPAFVMITPEGFVGSVQNTKMAERVSQSAFIGLYPQTAKLPTWTIAECVDLALTDVAGLADPLPEWIRREFDLPDLEPAFQAVHRPHSRAEHEQGVRRLLFDEAFATQAAMAYRRADASRHTAIARPGRPDGLLAAFDARLPFTLTDQQQEVGALLAGELDRARPMQRLLQGEVGSGKTVVALRAMLRVVDSGGQAVLLAPTEVLAHQHARTVSGLLGDLAQGPLVGGPAATELAVLTGSAPAAVRQDSRDRIASGQAGLVVGTHALLCESVEFADLGLVVVDEQHRFGVEQRNALLGRQRSHPHVLVMTATPIPRSVAMTVFGDLELATLDEVPGGRAAVATTVVDAAAKPAWLERAWQRLREEVAQGRQAYVVAPRIGPGAGGELDWLGSAVEACQRLGDGPMAGLRLGLLHGRLPAAEQDAAMSRFAAGDLDVLVATSMVEVGLDVPNASMMVVGEAERFGVSQLHQLRGRIGRGRHPGVCLLLTAAAEDSPARQRLELVASTHDGFALAEADLAQRREGDVLGLSQSGSKSSLRLLRALDHADLIQQARQVAEQAVAADPGLTDAGVADYVREIELLAEASLDDAA
ncbi:MAG: ATP-dependent DNA helicase RecG [Propionibacteriaceae bacterium]|jgi:ATP-dependent DNA helicase RecG|nr:ATP-dependent DNA helicase RecG [Propionibacteriaceae bacterium]